MTKLVRPLRGHVDGSAKTLHDWADLLVRLAEMNAFPQTDGDECLGTLMSEDDWGDYQKLMEYLNVVAVHEDWDEKRSNTPSPTHQDWSEWQQALFEVLEGVASVRPAIATSVNKLYEHTQLMSIPPTQDPQKNLAPRPTLGGEEMDIPVVPAPGYKHHMTLQEDENWCMSDDKSYQLVHCDGCTFLFIKDKDTPTPSVRDLVESLPFYPVIIPSLVEGITISVPANPNSEFSELIPAGLYVTPQGNWYGFTDSPDKDGSCLGPLYRVWPLVRVSRNEYVVFDTWEKHRQEDGDPDDVVDAIFLNLMANIVPDATKAIEDLVVEKHKEWEEGHNAEWTVFYADTNEMYSRASNEEQMQVLLGSLSRNGHRGYAVHKDGEVILSDNIKQPIKPYQATPDTGPDTPISEVTHRRIKVDIQFHNAPDVGWVDEVATTSGAALADGLKEQVDVCGVETTFSVEDPTLAPISEQLGFPLLNADLLFGAAPRHVARDPACRLMCKEIPKDQQVTMLMPNKQTWVRSRVRNINGYSLVAFGRAHEVVWDGKRGCWVAMFESKEIRAVYDYSFVEALKTDPLQFIDRDDLVGSSWLDDDQ